MDDGIEAAVFDEGRDEVAVADVSFDALDVLRNRRDISPFDGGVIKIVEVIEDRNGMPVEEQAFH